MQLHARGADFEADVAAAVLCVLEHKPDVARPVGAAEGVHGVEGGGAPRFVTAHKGRLAYDEWKERVAKEKEAGRTNSNGGVSAERSAAFASAICPPLSVIHRPCFWSPLMKPMFWMRRGVPRLCGTQKSWPGDHVR